MSSSSFSDVLAGETRLRGDGPHVKFTAAEGAAGGSASSGPIVLSANNIHKTYRKGKVAVPVLRGADVEIQRGDLTAIIGQSGSGKSTLLHLLATLDLPDEGEVYFEENRIDRLPAAGRDLLRNRYFGMVFQFYHLLPELSVLENVLVPCMISRGVMAYWWQRKALRERALELIEMVGLSHRIKHRPKELSGGEMQRASIARALIAEPKILFADEPTGNLDSHTGQDVLELLHSLKQREALTIVMVTHDSGIAREADRTLKLVEGRVA